MKDLPVVCTLTPDTIATRKAALLPGLARRASGISPLPDGLSLKFAAADDILQEIAAVIEKERQCCRFLEFDVRVEQDGGPIQLALTGPSGTREFLAALIND
jgi:hypothetical protein